jgi:hypothetical protein
MNPTPHPSLRLLTPEQAHVEVDLEMVPLVAWLWERGISTMGCCQGDPGGRAYVQFDAHADLCAALAGLYDHSPLHLRTAIAMKPSSSRPVWAVDVWTKLWWEGSRAAAWMPDGPDPLYYQLTMPRAHLRELTNLLLNA